MLLLVVMRRDDHVVAIHVAEVFMRVLYTHHFMSFENDRCGMAKDGFVDDTVETVVKDTHFAARGKGIFTQ